MTQHLSGRLQDKVAIVTGAASGIGRATVTRFVAEGAYVVATDVNQAALATLAAEMNEVGHPITTMICDVSQPAETARVVADTVTKFGRLDILVNSAGITPRHG